MSANNKEVERQMVFTTTLVDDATDKINDGIVVKKYQNPWLKGEVGIRRSSVSFRMSPEEQQEYIRCAIDIHYFTEKYCKTKREDGSVGSIQLRDYQKEILDNFINNRFNILMASRQVGKCFSFNTLCSIERDGIEIEFRIGKLYYYMLSKERSLTLLEKLKIKLYDWLYVLQKNTLIKIIENSIEAIESYEHRNLSLDEDDISKKIINSISLIGIKVKTDTGYEVATDIHMTQPYREYALSTKDFSLSCADNHILFDEKFNQIFVKDLKISDYIQTENGLQKVESISHKDFRPSMFDMTVDHLNHRFYTNGILSHNTVSSAIFILHTILFNNDKNVMIVANKGDTAIEIVDKVKSIYTLLPFFLKPGVKTWNQKSLTFDNGCRIKTSARSKTPAIGFTIDVLYLDEFAHIPSNIIDPYYTAAFPTVSAVSNSKIIITSTPNGMNLFHRLLIDAERPAGDPMKNNYKPLRVYWYQVPGRFVTYVRLNNHKLYEYGVTKEDIYNVFEESFGKITKVKMEFNLDQQKDVISVFNNDKCSDDMVKSVSFIDKNGYETSIMAIAELTTWKDEAVKDIGGEDAFNQEYGLRFINSSKSLLNESIIDDLLKSKKNYRFEEIEEFKSRLKFSYEDLKWVEDDTAFMPLRRKDYKFVLSVDISEGLGQDYSIINIFRISEKPMDLIEIQKAKYKSITDFFRLEQVGIYRNNFVSVKQLAELLYLIVFEYLNPDNVKVVLELNNYGNTLLAEMPHVFDGNNNYGSSVFIRYKHRVDSTEEKVGLKVGENKNMMVKDYQDLMYSKGFLITNEDNIREITTFVKHTTNAGNIRYAADVGHDDTVMTIVNTTSIFPKAEFKEMVDEWGNKNSPKDFMDYVNSFLKQQDFVEGIDYTQVLRARKQNLNKYKEVKNINWFNKNE